MVQVRVLRALEPDDRAVVTAFLHDAHVDDCAQLNDHLQADLHGGPRPGYLGVVAVDGAGTVVGYAQASVGHQGYLVDSIAWSGFDGDTDVVRRQLLTTLLAELPADAGITWWTHDASDAAPTATALGLVPGRSLLQMRCPLPTAARTDVATRPFVVGTDEAAWLQVNNAAFAWHAEQGGWDLRTIEQREREPWFRADGFLLHERDGQLAAFCWTKLHAADHPDGPTVGEIYVIAVHPDFHGLGLGKALTLAGLAWLHAAGATEGMLYVDAQNTGAVAMYHALDFHITHTDQAFARPPGGLQP